MVTGPEQLQWDEELRNLVIETLKGAAPLATLDLRVGVLNGIVHLGGAMSTQADRGIAEQLALGIPGVRGVVNRIEAPGAPSPGRTINLDL